MTFMKSRLLSFIAAFLLGSIHQAHSGIQSVRNESNKWESSIVSFEQNDRLHPPPARAILFIGSSTIVRWKSLESDFPGLPILNRGFGGSEISDINTYADRIVFHYAPPKIFFRAGSNDLHAGKSPRQVFDDFQQLASRVRAKLPETEFFYIALAPAIDRKSEAEVTRELNEMIRNSIKQLPHFHYIDAWSVTLDSSGNLRPELFQADKLHLNERGYKILADRVRPYL